MARRSKHDAVTKGKIRNRGEIASKDLPQPAKSCTVGYESNGGGFGFSRSFVIRSNRR